MTVNQNGSATFDAWYRENYGEPEMSTTFRITREAFHAGWSARNADSVPRRYAQHLPNCAALAWDGPNAPYPCSCGLDDVLRRVGK